jgi:kynureninase
MRVAPAPLYNSAEDVRCFVVELVAVVAELRKEGA